MRTILFTLLFPVLSWQASVIAAEPGPAAVIAEALKGEFPEFKISEVKPSRIGGLYEVMLGTDVIYVTEDGRYVIQGSMFDLRQRVNLSEAVRSQARVKVLKSIPASEIIEFAPEKTKYAIYVFTDIDCGYCRRLHKDVPELNKNGIAVRYLAFPRSGIGSRTYKNMESVWCAKDRHTALTNAKLGKPVKVAKCDNPVAKHFELGRDLGVRGTPAVYLENGTHVGGYISPAELIATLRGS